MPRRRYLPHGREGDNSRSGRSSLISECDSHTRCGAGRGLVGHTATTSGACEDCATRFYSPAEGVSPCLDGTAKACVENSALNDSGVCECFSGYTGQSCELTCDTGYTLQGSQPSCFAGILTNGVTCAGDGCDLLLPAAAAWVERIGLGLG